MTRYIDADEAKKALMGWETDPTDEEIEITIDRLPTVDVEPVRHGYWNVLDSYDSDMNAICSVCGNDTMQYYGSVVMDFDYCPCCGAKMDAERKE